MGARGSKLDRALEYFETASLREARVAYQLVKEVMEGRLAAERQPGLFAAAPKPKRTRQRRSKAQAGQQASAAATPANEATGADAAQPSLAQA